MPEVRAGRYLLQVRFEVKTWGRGAVMHRREVSGGRYPDADSLVTDYCGDLSMLRLELMNFLAIG